MYRVDGENKIINIFSSRLAKLTALHQIFNPDSTKIYGYNVYHILIVLVLLYIFTISMLLVVSLYYIMNDIIEVSLYMGYIGNFMFSSLKIINIIYYSEDIWKFTRVTNSSFMTYKHYNQKIYHSFKKRLTLLITIYLIVTCTDLFSLGLTPFIFNDIPVVIQRVNGSIGKYRTNIYNFFTFFPADKYNENFYVIYLIEFLSLSSYIYFTIIFDILIFMMTIALSCQLEVISDAISSVGHHTYAPENVKSYGLYYFTDVNI